MKLPFLTVFSPERTLDKPHSEQRDNDQSPQHSSFQQLLAAWHHLWPLSGNHAPRDEDLSDDSAPNKSERRKKQRGN